MKPKSLKSKIPARGKWQQMAQVAKFPCTVDNQKSAAHLIRAIRNRGGNACSRTIDGELKVFIL